MKNLTWQNPEQLFVAQVLINKVKSKCCGIKVYYHAVDNSTIEIDFLTQWHDRVIPIEVKAEVNVKAKSLRTFITNNPQLKGLRYSMLPYKDQDWMINVPLYACLTPFDKSF